MRCPGSERARITQGRTKRLDIGTGGRLGQTLEIGKARIRSDPDRSGRAVETDTPVIVMELCAITGDLATKFYVKCTAAEGMSNDQSMHGT